MKKYTFKTLVIILGLLAGQFINAQVKVACVGNSITYGYGLSSPSTQSYPSKLQEMLGTGYEVSNFGISARTLLKKGNLPYWNEPQYTQALSLKPDIVIIMLGTNDAKLNTNWIPHRAEFKSDYRAMIKAFSNLSSNPKIWVCEIVPAYQTIWEITDSIIANEVNPRIKEVAVEGGLSLVDMYTAMENKGSMFQSDGIHPTATGAEEMATYIYSVLLQDTLSVQKNGDTLKAPEAYSYQWYCNGQMISEEDSGKARVIIADTTGSYKVGLQLAAGSQTIIMSDTANYKLLLSVGNKQFKETQQVSLYPNSCNDFLTVKFDCELNQHGMFDIYKSDGGLIHSQIILKNNEFAHIDLHSLTNGVYFYKFKTDESLIVSGRFVVNHQD